ncbi:MAG: hypothetical protein GX052_05840 [Syntrophomonadaceae bacterium]|nr:hypothetical protein [Syntrophomonadaceae bacterium]
MTFKSGIAGRLLDSREQMMQPLIRREEMIGTACRLLIFNVLYAVLVWLTTYFPGLDLLAAAAFLYVLFIWSRRMVENGMNAGRVMATAFLAQLPGLVFSGLALYSWWRYGPLTSYFDFALQMWHTPFLPLLSLLPPIRIQGFPLYFLLGYILSPLYILLMGLFARTLPRRSGNRVKIYRLF